MAWRTSRNLENSLLKYITDNINADWNDINVGLSFSYKEQDLPFIACRLDSGTHPRLEIGSNLLNSKPLIIIDIYATSDGMRLDLAQYLIEKMIDGFDYYEYSPNPSDPDNPIKTKNGSVYTSDLSDNKVDLGENVDPCDKFRHRITCILERNRK